MPRPLEIMHASDDFERFLADVAERSGLETRNCTYTMVQGVFQTFRRRLNLKEGIRFANTLPPLLRAIFIADWDTENSIVPFSGLAEMTQEVQDLRRHHNLSPDSCIRDVAAAVRNTVDKKVFDEVLSSLPAGARDFWSD